MTSVHTINDKPLSECSDDEIHREWDAGMMLDTQIGLTPVQAERLAALEAEMARRPDFGKDFAE